jgi:hypothetical protein
MGGFGKAAVMAATLVKLVKNSGGNLSPVDAWNREIRCKHLGLAPSTQEKPCPRDAFLGLCEDGEVIGVPSGHYINPADIAKFGNNKAYALKAVELLRKDPSKANNKSALWREARGNTSKGHQEQMDVVVALWTQGFITR